MANSTTPIVILCGQAGSGKDTVGAYLAANFGGKCVAQADIIKRFAQRVFGFTDHQLWGPSSARNEPDVRTKQFAAQIAAEFYSKLDQNEILGPVIASTKDNQDLLASWFEGLYNKMLVEPISPRLVLQTIGTEFGRVIDHNIWSLETIKTCDKLLSGGYDYDRKKGLFLREGSNGYPFTYVTDGRFRNEILNVRYRGGLAVEVVRPGPSATINGKDIGGVAGHRSEAELTGVPAHFYSERLINDNTIELLQTKAMAMMHRRYLGE